MDGFQFHKFPLFQDLSPENRALIEPLFSVRSETAGNVLFEQGDLADSLYLVSDGEVVIRHKPEDGPAILITHVRNGGVVGWSAVLGNPTYTSSAICTSDCWLLYARSHDLRAFYEQNPKTGALLLERLVGVVVERLRVSHENVVALLAEGMQLNEQKSLTTG